MYAKITTLTTSISFFLAVYNFIIQKVVVFAINWVGYNTHSKVLTRTTVVTFVSQFFNTAFVLLLVEANLTEQLGSLGLNGSIPDFDKKWFNTIAMALIYTMIFGAVDPIVGFFWDWSMRAFARCRDRPCCSCDKNQTKTKTIQTYIDL